VWCQITLRFTAASCLVVALRLWLGLDLASGWLMAMRTYLYCISLPLSLSMLYVSSRCSRCHWILCFCGLTPLVGLCSCNNRRQSDDLLCVGWDVKPQPDSLNSRYYSATETRTTCVRSLSTFTLRYSCSSVVWQFQPKVAPIRVHNNLPTDTKSNPTSNHISITLLLNSAQ